MEGLHRSPTPYYTPPELQAFYNRCNKAVCKIDYPTCDTPKIPLDECRPFNYQARRPNPGGLKFYVYNYPLQTAYGLPLRNVGKGWDRYAATGKF